MREKYFIIYFKPKHPSPQFYICNLLHSKNSSEKDLLLSGISGYGLSYFSEGIVKRSYNFLIQEIVFTKYIINKEYRECLEICEKLEGEWPECKFSPIKLENSLEEYINSIKDFINEINILRDII